MIKETEEQFEDDEDYTQANGKVGDSTQNYDDSRY